MLSTKEIPAPAAVPKAATPNGAYTLGYLPALDGLRGISVFLILGYHDIGRYTSAFSHYLNGWFSVDLFFLVSGYLITSILLKEEKKNSDINLKKFYTRRWLRIAPAYYLCMAANIYWHCLGGDHHLAPFLYASLYLTNLDLAFAWNLIPLKYGISHFWTLGIEEQFYLFFPNLMRVLKKHISTAVLAVGATVFLWRGYLISHGADWMRIYHGFDTRVDTLMWGALAAIILANPKFREPLQKVLGNGVAQILLLFVIYQTCLTLGHPADGTKEQQLLLWQAKMPLLHCLISSFVMAVVLAPCALGSVLVSNPITVWLGKLSYGIYLWHPLVHSIYCGFYWTYFNSHPAESEAIQYALIFGIAAISYFLVELPFLKLKTKFA